MREIKNIKPLHMVEIKTESKVYRGILLERPELMDKKYIVIKLDSGYNIGIKKDRIIEINDFGEVKKEKLNKRQRYNLRDDMPVVSIIATGGTIASRVDYLTGGVHSAFSAEELISAVPELNSIAYIHGRQIFNKFSENMQPEDWVKIAKEVAREIRDKKSGIVITHGTDTMGYTAAALAFMIKTPLPIILTGAQRSSDRGSSDAAINLIHSTKVAGEADLGEVCVVMHETISDDFSLIHPATKVRKMHSSRRDAFQSINTKPIGRVSEKGIEFFLDVKRRGGRLELDTKLERGVFLLKYHPGLKPQIIDKLLEMDYKGVVIEGTGLGHVSENLFDSIRDAVNSGIVFCMTSQTINGRVNMNVYSTGRFLMNLGVIPCEDMLPETAYVKLMWVLGHTKKYEKVREMMLTNYAREISGKSYFDTPL